jgi:hypothetical protein
LIQEFERGFLRQSAGVFFLTALPEIFQQARGQKNVLIFGAYEIGAMNKLTDEGL